MVVVSAIMFGSYGVWSKLQGISYGIFYPAWTKALLISLILLPILLYQKQIVKIQKKDWKWMIVFFGTTSLTQAPLFYAFNHMNIGTATLLFFVTMMLTMVAVGILFLNEKLTTVKLISIIIACIGLYITYSFSIVFFTVFAALMAVLNGVASGSEVAFSKKLSGNYSPLYITWLAWIVIVISNGLISILIGEAAPLPEFNNFWLYQIGYAIINIFSFWLVIKGFKYVEASIGGLIGLLEIVFSLLFGFLIFHEGLSAKVIVGALLILCAAALPHIVELLAKEPKTEVHS